MAIQRKLQVFVSSTYTDLRAERQAAVEAILTAGHIPAGMELFAAGDESQLTVIKRWIEESDVFLLILGGRYGSLETNSGKSYIQLEYEYAVQLGKPLFAVVIEDGQINERVKQAGVAAIEQDNPQLLKQFRGAVLTRLSRFWRDPKDIKLAILETLSEFSRRTDLVGWIPGSNRVDSGALAEEIARLGKENASLRDMIAKNGVGGGAPINGLSFGEMYALLSKKIVRGLDASTLPKDHVLRRIASTFGEDSPSLLHVFWAARHLLSNNARVPPYVAADLKELERLRLIHEFLSGRYTLTNEGRAFLLRLELEASADAELLFLSSEERSE
jgi:hypothetical protein